MKFDISYHRLFLLLLIAAGFLSSNTLQAQNQRERTSSTNRNTSTSSSTNPNSWITSQNEEPDTTADKGPEGIIYDMDEEADSLMPGYVFIFPLSWRDVKIRDIQHPSLDPTGVQMNNAAYRMDGLYFTDLGALGLPQLSILPYATLRKDIPLSWNLLPECYTVYRTNLHEFKLFQTQKPYTLLRYGSSLNKDYQIGVIHTQNIKPRWNIAFLYDLVSRDGLYTNSGVTNHVVDVTTNYYSQDARYQLQAAIKYNRFRQEENGGVTNDTSCWDYSRRAGAPVNMYSAQNQWRDLGLHLHQSYNTVRQFYNLRPHKVLSDSSSNDTITLKDKELEYDTIYPHKPTSINTGIFALDIDVVRHRRIFYDNRPDSWFYDNVTLDTSFFYDSTTHYQLSSELYWTNDAYMRHRWKNPFVITFGIRPEYNQYRFVGSHQWQMSVSPFAKGALTLGNMKLEASAEEVTGGYRNGDYTITGGLTLGKLSITALSEALSPEMIYYHNEGIYNWDYSNYNKIKRQEIAADYCTALPDSSSGFLRLFSAKASASLLSDKVWINANMQPEQGNESGVLLHGTVSAHLRFGWFNIRLQESLQHCNNTNVEELPLFASKNSIYADIYMFKRALRMQTGFDLRYHTKYYSDAWNPILGMYYRQDDVEVGGYLVADFWINLQIKRASIYLKASHFNAPLEEMAGKRPDYFSLPHYPMEDFGLYWGVIWKFFN